MPKPRNIQKKIAKSEEKLNKQNEEDYQDYIDRIKDKNKRYLLKLSQAEKERIVETVIEDWYKKDLPHHQDICDKIDKYDEQWRMTRKEVKGTENVPNYRQALSTVILEVVHANVMNVFFGQKDILAVLPTEPNDVSKIPKVNTFMNWSALNELKMFKKCDRMFHNSGKTGGAPYKISWTKEYGMITKRRKLFNPFDPAQPLVDPETNEVLEQEYDEAKLLYDGPVLEVFSRKDWIIPENAVDDKKPAHEIHRMIKTKDDLIRGIQNGSYYSDILTEDPEKPYIKFEQAAEVSEIEKKDREDQDIPLAKDEKTVLEGYGGYILHEEDDEIDENITELEQEYIFTVCLEDRTLIAARKNKFPLKERSIGLCPFMPDDEGRIDPIGVMEFMENIQLEYDALHNEGLQSVILQNEPILLYTPMGNQKAEPTKIQAGYAYPSANPEGAKIFQFPGPSAQLFAFMKIVLDWAEKVFPMGEYAAGKISEIDPDAPARKVERILEQINTRLNLIVKRYNIVMKSIFRKLFLLYQDNMPPNKFMRITGTTSGKWTEKDFIKVNLSDFALKSIPDFELTGNILASNKVLEARKATAIYDRMLQNVLFDPRRPEGAQAYHHITKWWLDKMDALGVSDFLPEPQEQSRTPEEENVIMLEGGEVEPDERDNHLQHIRKVNELIANPTIPVEIKRTALAHLQKHYKLLQMQMQKEIMFGQGMTGRGGQGGEREGAPRAGAGMPAPVAGAMQQ
jgi:hypothetical protein